MNYTLEYWSPNQNKWLVCLNFNQASDEIAQQIAEKEIRDFIQEHNRNVTSFRLVSVVGWATIKLVPPPEPPEPYIAIDWGKD